MSKIKINLQDFDAIEQKNMRAFDANSDIKPRAVVDLPEPDSPTMARTWPGLTSKFISTAAGYQMPSTQNSTVKSWTFSTGSLIGEPFVRDYLYE